VRSKSRPSPLAATRAGCETLNDRDDDALNAASDRRATGSLAHSILTGSSSLGLSVVVERGLGFTANLVAARVAGTQIFGAYSLALTTANNIASYAGAGIGTTANRFAGQYPEGSSEYGRLQRALGLVSVQSAGIALVILWFAAGPLARHLLANPALAHLLRLSSFSAGAVILLECMRGFLIGQRRFSALLGLSALFGGGLLLVIPVVASHGPSSMIVAQASVAGAAVAVCVVVLWQSRTVTPTCRGRASGPSVGHIWRFGLVQLAAVIGLNAAGWWAASLVARGDRSMVQMGLYAAATQLRNVIAIVPGLVSQSSFALLAEERGLTYGGPGRVLIGSTLVATLLAVGLSGLAVATLPWTLGALYGAAFRPAELAASLAICTALVHMAAAPAASRLTLVSLRLTGIVNAIWTVLVIGLATWLIRDVGAVEATSVFLIAHFVSALLVLVALRHRAALPAGLLTLSVTSLSAAGALAVLAYVRLNWPGQSIPVSIAMLLLTTGLLLATVRSGHKVLVLPSDFLGRRIRHFCRVSL
jgi:O-antigen/teichoic acid export membrane protein